jgi:uncharacterized repeat protein (TIGR02543 family)
VSGLLYCGIAAEEIYMKRKKLWLAILAMALVFGMTSVGCGNGSDTSNGTCTVTFDLDGGNIGGDTASVPMTVTTGGTAASLPFPAKADNTFGGWFISKNGAGTEFTTATKVASDLTVYAKWITAGGGTTHTVTFDLDGGNIIGNTASVPVTVNSGGTIPYLPGPAKAGNTFGGWFASRNGAGAQFTTATPVTSNLTVYAKWTTTGGGAPDTWTNPASFSQLDGTWKSSYSETVTFQEYLEMDDEAWQVLGPFEETFGNDMKVAKTVQHTYLFNATAKTHAASRTETHVFSGSKISTAWEDVKLHHIPEGFIVNDAQRSATQTQNSGTVPITDEQIANILALIQINQAGTQFKMDGGEGTVLTFTKQ